ncbi:MAG: hypothetical protein KAU52_00180 [Methanosarcinales archaeon]|nr:hypothetical protein [Methanosarcinales archaeon]
MGLKETCLIVIAAATLCIFAQSAVATSVISVDPAHTDVWQGEEFAVNITIYPAENEVYGASYTLHFDNTLLNATTQAKGPFLTQDGEGSTIYKNKIDNAIGEIIYAEGRSGTTAGVNGSDVLATITFQAIGEGGVSSLNLSDLDGALLYSLSGSIPTTVNNGTYMIGQTPTPTSTPPTTTTIAATPMQTPTTIIITPTPTATVIQTPTILSTPSLSPTIIISPTPVASTPPSEEKSEENNRLSGFTSVFAVTGLFAVLILKRKDVRKRN